MDSIPAPASDGTVALQAVVDAALAYLEQRTARSNALDRRAGAAHLVISRVRSLKRYAS